jgi:hypothetical protein
MLWQSEHHSFQGLPMAVIQSKLHSLSGSVMLAVSVLGLSVLGLKTKARKDKQRRYVFGYQSVSTVVD